MGIDDPKRCRLEPQMRKHPAEHGVLVHIGEIARMKGVAVIHRCHRARHADGVSMFSELIAIDKVLAAGLVNW
jgi:hypothetical protein